MAGIINGNFDKAQQIVMAWPGDKEAPAKLAAMLNETGGDPTVAMFFEALYAAAQGEDDLELIASSRELIASPDEAEDDD